MTSTIPAHVYESKRRAFLGATLSGVILCVFCPISLQAIGRTANKTDVELTEAVIGTWEVLPSEGFSKTFLTFNANGTGKVIGITDGHDSPRRAEGDARWRVNQGYLIAEAMKTTYRGIRIRFNVRSQIESM